MTSTTKKLKMAHKASVSNASTTQADISLKRVKAVLRQTDTIMQWREDWYLFLWSTTLLLPTLLSNSQVSISLVIHGL